MSNMATYAAAAFRQLAVLMQAKKALDPTLSNRLHKKNWYFRFGTRLITYSRDAFVRTSLSFGSLHEVLNAAEFL